MFFFTVSVYYLLLELAQCTTLPPRMLQDLTLRTNISMEKYYKTEETIRKSQTHLSQDSPSWYLGASHEMNEGAKNLSRRALQSETMAMIIVEALNMSSKDVVWLLPSVGTFVCSGDTAIAYARNSAECKRETQRYRTHSGKCNNYLHPTWGGALEAYARFLPPEYQDGVSLPRTKLPSARDVSTKIHAGGPDFKHPHLMALTPLFGQFLANDFAHTPRMELTGGIRLKCCDVDYENFHPECFPIRAENRVGCMEYARSAPHPGNSLQGCLGPRQQINQASSYLDLSTIYGNSEETARALRLGSGGRLNTQQKNLPMPATDSGSCRSESKSLPCFFSGDPRINENPGLALMHVLFLREHNRVADQLALLNPTWEDEKLYQEARRVVIAEMQHITYNEFLPVILGEGNLDRFDLRLTSQGYFRGYDSKIDATISNAAGSAGLFFVAALTPKTLDLVDPRSEVKSGERSLLSAFYAPQELYEAGAIDRLIAGATAGHSRKPLPPGLNEILLERYFHDGKTRDIAVDYAAQAIQQGRDHGLAPYVRWRAFCELPEVTGFRDLEGSMTKETIERLQKVYKNVEDIDLVSGALSEIPAEGSVVGATFLCLLGRTFRNARLGDRYWYENANSPGSFTAEQLEEIRKSTMAKVLCDNGDSLRSMQPRAFILKDPFLNELSECATYLNGAMDLTLWKERTNGSQVNSFG
ncbi:peroxidase-like [Venturia canescens]|uniref:peroxidase-like n=1 Tax=Venturia canescens TaxID=32260 RepID=UPI001C9C1C1B|nr:peroxidase-like [Venturia canescens]